MSFLCLSTRSCNDVKVVFGHRWWKRPSVAFTSRLLTPQRAWFRCLWWFIAMKKRRMLPRLVSQKKGQSSNTSGITQRRRRTNPLWTVWVAANSGQTSCSESVLQDDVRKENNKNTTRLQKQFLNQCLVSTQNAASCIRPPTNPQIQCLH